MWEHDIGSVPVLSPHGQLVGMLTDRDITFADVGRLIYDIAHGRPRLRLRQWPATEASDARST
jgi:CBS domain-containing protein